MMVVFGYSVIQLIFMKNEANLLEMGLGGLTLLFLGMQTLILIIQEWLLLWNKEYYA
jgi:hypothetical protein